jgi:serine phosphatase RsbU (regulator of sigma subunit)
MLDTLHQALHHQPRGADLCTVCLVTMSLSGDGAQVNIALAGHEQPLLIDPRGRVNEVGEPGTLLGVLDSISINERQLQLRPGYTLLLFTDGVIDAGRPGRPLGASGLRALCAEAPELSLKELLERIERAARAHARGSLHDDIALLALRLREPGVAGAR